MGRGTLDVEHPSSAMQRWWRFADGKIAFFRGSEDTAQSAAAFT
jgi:hypothetical protein